MFRIVRLNAEGRYAVYATRAHGRYETPMVFDGTLGMCRDYRKWASEKKTAYSLWRILLLAALSESSPYWFDSPDPLRVADDEYRRQAGSDARKQKRMEARKGEARTRPALLPWLSRLDLYKSWRYPGFDEDPFL